MKTGFLALGLTLIGSSAGAQAQSCIQSTQRIQVPEQIQLAQSCQVPPVMQPKLSFLLSENGTDAYRVEWPPTKLANPARENERAYEEAHPHYPLTVETLFVYQEEASRMREIKSFIDSGGFGWFRGGFQSGNRTAEDWKPILSIKYSIYKFVILNPSGQIQLTQVRAYAPIDCYAYGTRCVNGSQLEWESEPRIRSSEIGEFNNYSPQILQAGSMPYRVGMMIVEELSHPKK